MPPNSIAFLEKESKARPHISKHKMVLMKNSTDFAMGRRPKIKSEEFFISTFLGVEMMANLCLKPLKNATLFGSTTPTGVLLTHPDCWGHRGAPGASI